MNVLSLFSGIGGLDLAAEAAGMTTIAFCEQDAFCQKVLKKHWPHVPCYSDVKVLKGDEIGQTVNLVSAGFPCQPHSTAGKRLGEQDERNLWPDVTRILAESGAEFFVGENVTGILSTIIDQCIRDLEAQGYQVEVVVLPASAVGAEHRRERVFIVAHNPRLRVQGVRAKGQQVARPLDKSLPTVRDSNGQWEVEPDLRRAFDGVPKGLDVARRLKALGNAVVPQQAYPIFKAIADMRHSEIMECEFCGYEFDTELGRYGCPNCEGEGLAA